jgi:hypothetical protein
MVRSTVGLISQIRTLAANRRRARTGEAKYLNNFSYVHVKSFENAAESEPNFHASQPARSFDARSCALRGDSRCWRENAVDDFGTTRLNRRPVENPELLAIEVRRLAQDPA